MIAARPLLAALLLALAVAPSHQLPAATGFHSRRLAGSGHDPSSTGGGGGDGWAPAARRRLAAVQPLTPVSTQVQGQEVLYQVPKQPVGMVVLLHKCGRSAGDFWPYSSQGCSTCQGLPNSVAKMKQALARGYAVVAVSSRDRSREGRCFSMNDDAPAVAEVVSTFPAKLGLPAGAPVYVDGASSGGSLALRLPRLAKFSGIIGEVIGPPNFSTELQLLDQSGLGPMPPTLYIHMPRDEGMAVKVRENIALLHARGTPVAEIQVFPRPVTPAYFASCSPYISNSLAVLLHTRLKGSGLLDGTDMVAVDLKDARWGEFRSYTNGPMEADLAGMPDQGVKFAPLLSLHIFDCLGVAWGRHETIGEYMTAALVWLENRGQVDIAEVAARFRVPRLADLQVDAATLATRR